MLMYKLNLHALKFTNYKHIRFKTINTSTTIKKLPNELHKQLSETLCDILNCNIYTAREIVARNKDIGGINQLDFSQNVKFCHEYFKLSDLIECSWILTLQPSLFQHRYFALKELGFYNVTPHYVLRFPFILKETPETLKAKGFPIDCKYKSDTLTKYFSETVASEINNHFQSMYNNGSTLQKIKEVMNAEYFSAKLECSISKVHWMFKNYATLRVQSLHNTDLLLNILLWRFGVSLSKIYSCPYMLSLHHETVGNFITEITEILGVNTLHIIKKIPFILRQETNCLKKIEDILKEFNITKDQLICCPRVLLIAPETLHKRLSVICGTEEFAVLKSNKKFLWLVYNFKKLNSRLTCLKNENMPCSINMFTVTKNTFDKYIVYNNTRTSMREAYEYLANVFKITVKEISLRFNNYSSNRIEVQTFSALNCQKVIEFLLLSGVTKKQIFNGLEIVFYEIDTVKEFYKNLRHHHACQPFEEWNSHFNLIQLLIYTIEVVEYHSYKMECDERDQFIEQSSLCL